MNLAESATPSHIVHNRDRRLFWLALALWIGPVLFLGVFYFYPLISILGLSLGRAVQGASPWAQLFSPTILQVVWFTFYQAVLSTLLTLLIGLPGAVWERFPAPT